MIALDATFLVDYLAGVQATRAYLEERENQPFAAPSLALFEVYRGAARVDGPAGVDRAASALDWADPLELTNGAARQAASIDATLRERGEPVTLGDALIGGICRHFGARLLTRHSHVEQIPRTMRTGASRP